MEDVLEYDDTDIESDIESDESDESDERTRRRRRRYRPQTPTGQGLYRSRPTNNPVTQAQLQTALDRVGQQIKTGSTATQQLSARVNALTERLDKEMAARKKADAEQKKAASSSSMNMLVPLLLLQGGTEISDKEGEKRQKLGVVTRPGGGAPPTKQDVEVLDAQGNPFANPAPAEAVTQNTKFKSADIMLPLVLMMTMGGTSGGSSDNSMMMMLPLILLMKK